MPYRKFDTSTWTDPWFEALHPDSKLLFIYLWTNSLCNQAGVYEISLTRIANETTIVPQPLPNGIDTRKQPPKEHAYFLYLLKSLTPKIVYKQSKELVYIRNYARYQCQNPNFCKAAIELVKNSDPQILHDYVTTNADIYKKYNIELPDISNLEPLPNSYHTVALTETVAVAVKENTKEKTGIDTPKASIDLEVLNGRLEVIWDLWPKYRKTSRDRVRPKLKAAIKRLKGNFESLSEAVKEYVSSPLIQGIVKSGETQWIPLLSTWLHNGGWTEDRAAWQKPYTAGRKKPPIPEMVACEQAKDKEIDRMEAAGEL